MNNINKKCNKLAFVSLLRQDVCHVCLKQTQHEELSGCCAEVFLPLPLKLTRRNKLSGCCDEIIFLAMA